MVANIDNKQIHTSVASDVISESTELIIEIKELWRKFFEGSPAEVQALRGVNFRVEKGEFITIMGPSGSGKSTLLTIIGCMSSATSGEVFIDGTDITKMNQRKLSEIRKKKIGFVFQDIFLIDTISALDNVLLPLLPYGIKREDKERAIELLTTAGLEDRMHHKPTELSGGQKQRVAICRALINDPPLVLADEPTGNLDSQTGGEILELLMKINTEKGITILAVSHDPKLAEFSSRDVMITDGEITRDRINPFRDYNVS
ncbi:MAG: ABC transporter ATP-binding protein [Candidatus Heimdallarchaeota archaeon]|nr:ABC transporter ATP-binding protein [Candidatus Heimdallarchaeota archaeon]